MFVCVYSVYACYDKGENKITSTKINTNLLIQRINQNEIREELKRDREREKYRRYFWKVSY